MKIGRSALPLPRYTRRKRLKKGGLGYFFDVPTWARKGRHGGTTEASTSGLTETQLMKKGQWSSTKAMAHYLHHDDEAKQDAQIKRIKRRKQAAKK